MTNIEGRVFQVKAAGKRAGDSRPGWKILRQLGQLAGVAGCGQVSLEEVQSELGTGLPAIIEGESPIATSQTQEGLYRVGEVPMYSVDALCRRSAPLQASVHADNAFAGLNPDDASRLGLAEGDTASIDQGGKSTELPVRVTRRVPAGAVWLRSAHAAASTLGDAMGAVTVAVTQKGAE